MKKQTSADLYEALITTDLFHEEFDRTKLRHAIWVLDDKNGSNPLEPPYPSEDSFIDWAMKHEKITRVSKGLYQFVQEESEEEAEQDEPLRSDTELDDVDTGAFEELMPVLSDYLVKEQTLEDKMRVFQEAAEIRPEDMYVIVDDVKRLPRKRKKQMKRDLLRATVARKVTFGYLPQPS